MNLLLWKEQLVEDFDTAFAKAEAGAAYLDRKFGRHWDKKIDLERVDILSPFSCMLAQLNQNGLFCLPSIQRGIDCGFSCGLLYDFYGLLCRPPKVVRAYALLSQAWKAVLLLRREQFDCDPEQPARRVGREKVVAV